MDLSCSLKFITKSLLKINFKTITIKIKKQKIEFSKIISVKILLETSHSSFTGYGSDRSIFKAYLKALSELNERYAFYSSESENSSGFASGVIKKRVQLRAKAEIIERDAFLFHYQEKTPWSLHKTEGNIILYKLNSAESKFITFLATDTATSNGLENCLIFGCGTDLKENEKNAEFKAVSEYNSLKQNHLKNPNFCELASLSKKEDYTTVDQHHLASRDKRNILIFKDLCSSNNINFKNNKNNLVWEIMEHKSILKGFHVQQAKCSSLRVLQFGKPEPDSENLFHPFW